MQGNMPVEHKLRRVEVLSVTDIMSHPFVKLILERLDCIEFEQREPSIEALFATHIPTV
jgi:hypothetical protein